MTKVSKPTAFREINRLIELGLLKVKVLDL